MKIKFLGAAGTVTGSSYALTSDGGETIVIDMGMFQGLPEIEDMNYREYELDCNRLIGVVLTHAHLDHCGRLPILVQNGFGGHIWMTPPTRDLAELSLLDSAKIAEFEKKKKKRGLYNTALASRTIKRFKTVSYRNEFKIGDFVITMRDAGHILGSASLEVTDSSARGEMKKIVFSGDLGNTPEELVEATETIEAADAVVMESTYGDRQHPDEDAREVIAREIAQIEQNGGTLLIPAFALERTQELLHIIRHLKMEDKIRMETPVLVDSPMANRATEIYKRYPEWFNRQVEAEMRTGMAFEFAGLEEENGDENGPRVIIAGSGMMTGGRVLEHAINYLPKTQTRLLIVGYQGEGTLGREIMEGARQVNIYGQAVAIAATVNDTQAMSSHADQRQLLDWLGQIAGVKKVFLTHGEKGPRQVLAGLITEKLGIDRVETPAMNSEAEV